MKKIFPKLILLTFVFCFQFGFAQTIIPEGDIFGTWTQEGSPYLIEGNIKILDDSSLTIEPGVIIEFQGHFSLTVFGSIFANGTSSDTIVFTTTQANQENGWHHMVFDDYPDMNKVSELSYCKFEYGYAHPYEKLGTRGGAIYAEQYNQITISNSRFINNRAQDKGGAIMCGHLNKFTLSNCSFINNSAIENFSGAVEIGSSTNVLIDRCIFIGNSSPSGSGALAWYNNDGMISNCVINENIGYSSAIRITNGGQERSVDFVNNTISGNIGETAGGISFIGNDNTTTNFLISNNLVVNNSATSSTEALGGGVVLKECNPIISNNTISNNYSAKYGGGIYFEDLTYPEIYNTIIFGNSSGIYGSQVHLEENTCDPNFYNCDIEGGIEDFSLSNGVTYDGDYENNINIDPLFMDATSLNYLLSCNSSCINRGTPDTTSLYLPEFDLRSLPRIKKDTIDIGAYEYQPLIIINQPQNTNACEQDTVILTCQAAGDFINYQWKKNNENLEGEIQAELVFEGITNEDQGLYSCEISNTCENLISQSVEVFVYEKPIVNLGENTTITIKDTLVLNAGEEFESYLWQDGSSSQYYYVYGPQLDPAIYNYSVIVSTSNGCENSDEIDITVIEEDGINELQLANMFTISPNPGNGIFTIHFKSQTTEPFTIEVLDIKGREVLSTNLQSGITKAEIDLSEFEKGLYMLYLKSKEYKAVRKVIIL
jgi:predicted outer membrane repeat protein